jgi:hypothetical protein
LFISSKAVSRVLFYPVAGIISIIDLILPLLTVLSNLPILVIR